MSTSSAIRLQARPVGRARLASVPDFPGADVLPLESAPSARRRREALRLDPPSSRRRPALRVRSAAESSMSLRRVLVGSLATLALGIVGAGAGLLVSPGAYDGPTTLHAVTAGESVWSIAQTVATDRPLEDVVTDIESLNGVDGALIVGQLLEVPVR